MAASATAGSLGRSLVQSVFRWDAGAFVFAVVSSVCFAVARVAYIGIVLVGSPLAPYAWLDRRALILAFGQAGCIMVGLYFLATALMAAWTRGVGGEGEVTSYRASLARRFWPCFAVIALCWTPWVVASMPATMDQDTIWQVLIWRTPAMWYDHHPWLTTALFGTLFDIGAALGSQSISLGIAGVVQSLLYVAVTSASLAYVGRFRRGRPFFWVALVWCCLVPAFPYYACRLQKDSLFLLGFVPAMILVLDGIRTRGRSLGTPTRVVGLCLLVLWSVLTKKTGVYILIPTLAILAIFCRAGDWRPPVAACVAGVVGFGLWQGVVLSAIGVAPGPSKELYSLPFQQTARYVALHPDDVTPEEREAIAAVLPYDSLAALYDARTADPIKDNFVNLEMGNLVPYFRAWLAMGLRHPGTYATATLGTNLALFYGPPFATVPGSDPAWVEENVRFFSQFLLEGLTPEEIAARDATTGEGISEWPATEGLRERLEAYALNFETMPLTLFDSPAVVEFYLPFLCACCLLSPCFRGARAAVFAAVVPWALVVASIVIGPMGLDRYYITGLWCVPLLLCLPLVCGLSREPVGSATVVGRHGAPRRSGTPRRPREDGSA